MTESIWIRVPTPPADSADEAKSYRLDAPLKGKRVGIRIDEAWRSWTVIAEEWTSFLKEDGADVDILLSTSHVGQGGAEDVEDTAAWAGRIDLGISGLGNCGSCTAYSVRDAIAIEAAGKPAVIAATAEFEKHAGAVARHMRHPDLKVLVLPYPLEGKEEPELKTIAREYYPRFLDLVGVAR